jgi:hypothetical protein
MRKFVQQSLMALALGIGGIATPAAASTISYAWTGTVTNVVPGSLPVVHHGQRIGITLTLDDSVPDQDASPNRGIFDQQEQPPDLVVAVNIGGFTTIGSFQFGTVLANDGGVDEFKITSASQHVGDAFGIDFKTSHPGVLTSDSLPLSIDPHDFELATFIVNGPNNFLQLAFAPRFSGTIDFAGINLTQTPLPGSVGMFVPALLGLLGLGEWQRRRAG